MKSQFRSTTPQDAAAVAAFLQRVFGMDPGHPTVEPGHMYWKCWENRADWPGSRGYVMTKESEIVAHGSVVPLSCRCGDRRLKVIHLIDWAAEPKSVGSGVTLLKRIGQSVDAILVVGGSESTQKILPALGFKTCGQVTRYARPLRPLRRLAGQTNPTWRLGAQFARSLLWSWRAPAERVQGWEVCRIAPDQLVSAAIPWPKPGPKTAVFERTAEMMSYYLRCPATPMELYAVAKEGSVRGYFLTAFAPAQARVVDFWIDSGDRGDWRALVQLAVRQARQNHGVAEVVSVGSDPFTMQSLVDCGFHARGSDAMRMLACGGNALPETAIRFQMLDSDAAYLHNGGAEFWA